MAQAFKLLLLVGAGYAGLCLLVFLFQSRLVFAPSADRAGTPADIGLAFEEVRLTSQGNRIQAWFVPAEAIADRPVRGAVLFCHGNAGNITHRLDTLRILHGLGLDALIFDYQGYGLSEGRPGEQAAYADARAAWDWLMARGMTPDRVVVMGRSLGGAVAAALAESLAESLTGDVTEKGGPGPAGLILESTFTSVPDMGAQRFPFLPVRLLSRYSFDTLARVGSISCPVLVIHSPEDDIVPYGHGLALATAFRQAGNPAEFLELGGDHNTGFLAHKPRYVRGLDEFFSRVLGPRP